MLHAWHVGVDVDVHVPVRYMPAKQLIVHGKQPVCGPLMGLYVPGPHGWQTVLVEAVQIPERNDPAPHAVLHGLHGD